MKMKRTIPCLALSLLIVLGLLTGCGGNSQQNSDSNQGGATTQAESSDSNGTSTDTTSADTGANTENRDKLVITVTLEGNADAKDSMVEEAYQQLMSEKLGRELEIKYTMIPGSEYGDKAKLLLATGDLTDFFQIPFLYDYAKPASEGFFLDLMPHKDKLSNYFKYIEQTDGGIANIMNSSGNIYALAGIGLPRFPADMGMLPDNLTMYRVDIFEENGIAIPETLDELYDAAKKLKEIYPDTYPINTRWKDLRSLFRANHTNNGVYWNGEEYVMGLFDEGYKEAIEYAQKLYVEGLLDPEYIVETDDTLKSKELTDRTLIVLADWFTTPGEFSRLSDSGQIFAAALHPNNPKYGTAWHSVQRVNEISTNVFYNAVVSSKVKDVDGVLEFINRSLDEDAIRLLSWGIEGTTYTLDGNGDPQFVDSILNADDPWIEADKYGMRASRNKRPGLSMIDDATAFVAFAPNDWLYYEGGLHVEPIEKSPYYLSIPYPDNDYTPPYFSEPKLQFTDDESQQKSQIQTAIETYRDEMQARFVAGEESMDNWDTYIEGVRGVGDVDTLLKIYNDAAQRYLANK